MKRVKTIVPIFIILFNVLIIMFPKEVVAASRDGVSLWLNNVLPSLLPFMIGVNILSALGVVDFIGKLLAPVMYPLFGVPGSGGFAMVTGMMSGYPMGAKITAALREEKTISKTEAERLLGFANNSGPLFVLGAVGIGMFNNEKVGVFILLIHYAAAIITGLLMKYYKRSPREKRPAYESKPRVKDTRGVGRIFGDSVKSSMETVLVIGGYIILFSVISKLAEIVIITPVFNRLSIDAPILRGVASGLLEVTNGSRALSALGTGMAPVLAAAACCSFGGFSIHAQSISFIQKTDISVPVYIGAKTIQSLITVVLGAVLYPFFDFTKATPAVTAFARKLYGSGGFFDYALSTPALFLASAAVITAAILSRFARAEKD